MLSLYAFYKQATVGDVQGNRPTGFDIVGKAKYDAWAKVKGTSSEMAMQAYVELVKRLQAASVAIRKPRACACHAAELRSLWRKPYSCVA